VVEIVSNGIMQPIKEYRIEYNGQYSMDADCVLHIKDFNPYYDGTGSHLYGQSPLRAGLRSLTTNNEAVTTGVKYLQNQTARGVLMSEEGDLNEVQAQQLKDKFRQQYQGSDNGGDVIITPKKLSWVNFGLNAADVSLIEQYNASIKDICNIYNVPVQLLNNTEASTYNNMKEAKKALYQNAVIPELVKLRDELNRWLVPMYGDNLYLDFDFTAIPELQEENDKVVQQLSAAWWITPNEKRAVMNYGKDEDTPAMDDYYIPSNLLPVSNQDIEIPEPAPMAVDIEAEKQLIKQALKDIVVSAETVEAKADDLDTKAESYDDYPQTASNNAKRMLGWIEEYGRDVVTAGTNVGLARAQQLSSREPISLDVLKRTRSYLERAKTYSTVDPKYKDEPWLDNGFVAYNLWGGEAMRVYANKKLAELEENA
jgi:HK97 family phage portal protein